MARHRAMHRKRRVSITATAVVGTGLALIPAASNAATRPAAAQTTFQPTAAKAAAQPTAHLYQQDDLAMPPAAVSSELSQLGRAERQLATQQQQIQQTLTTLQHEVDALNAAQKRAASHAAKPTARSSSPSTKTTTVADTTKTDTSTTSQSGAQSQGTFTTPSGVTVSGPAATAVQFALSQIGKPYEWGGTGPYGWDCSGLVQAAWAAAGVNLPRSTYSQVFAGSQISQSQLQPGDLVFYFSGPSHVAMYIGNGQVVQAPHPGATVDIVPINHDSPITAYVHIGG